MKHLSTACLLLLLVSMTGFAVPEAKLNSHNQPLAAWHPITIYNDSDAPFVYYFKGLWKSKEYTVAKKSTDIFHSTFGAQKSQFFVKFCVAADSKGACTTYTDGMTNGKYYNAELVQAIRVKFLNRYTVICIDGGSRTCLAKG